MDQIAKQKLISAVLGEEYCSTEVDGVDSALSLLNERERFILINRYSGLTLKKIGELLPEPVSRVRVGQIEGRALRKLRHPLKRRVLLNESGALAYYHNYKKVKEIKKELCICDRLKLSNLPILNFSQSYDVWWGFSLRTTNCLKRENIKTIGELALKTSSELQKIRGIGRKTLNDILEALNETK